MNDDTHHGESTFADKIEAVRKFVQFPGTEDPSKNVMSGSQVANLAMALMGGRGGRPSLYNQFVNKRGTFGRPAPEETGTPIRPGNDPKRGAMEKRQAEDREWRAESDAALESIWNEQRGMGRHGGKELDNLVQRHNSSQINVDDFISDLLNKLTK